MFLYGAWGRGILGREKEEKKGDYLSFFFLKCGFIGELFFFFLSNNGMTF